jgi:hypothetical protein
MSDEPLGTKIGDYEILSVLGAGGMGKVYKVRNVLSDRIEAMKVLLPNLTNQKDLADRFLREIKVLASLDHPNIAALRTALTVDNQLIMIMEYVEGNTLSARLERGAIPCAEAVQYIGQVLDALSYAHKRQIIHRDIKPANMMLTPGGAIKLMDFGIARSDLDVGLTTTGTTLGSLAYMSPEQVKCEPVDARSDLYSVGVSFYEMVTGQRPFQSDSNFAIMQAHLQEPPKLPMEVKPDLPQGISEIIMIAMAKSPADRFQSADAFRNALQSVAGSLGAVQTPLPAAAHAPASQVARRSGSTMPMTGAGAPAASTPAPAPAAQSVPIPPPRASGTGHRGLYIGLGAFIVLIVLVAAGFSLPRFLGTRAGSRASQPAMSKAPAVVTPAAETPQQPATPQQVAPVAAAPAADQSAPANPEPAHAVETPSFAPSTPSSHSPSRASVPSAPASAQQPPAEALPAAPAGPSLADQLEELDHNLDQLSSREISVNSSLDTLQRQMASQGLNLRGDIVAAQARVRANLAKAQAALQAKDPHTAQKYLDMAEPDIEKLEKFLGR